TSVVTPAACTASAYAATAVAVPPHSVAGRYMPQTCRTFTRASSHGIRRSVLGCAGVPTQDEIFTASEADQWFERNKHVLERLDDQDVPLRLVELYQLAPKAILEIGAANGYRVAELAKRTGARAVAVEPSQRAVEDGRARFPHV